jgi:5-(carboxyamino)imidazole ribonucleotide synthase
LAQQAIDAAQAVAQGLNYVGVLCVEFFVVQEAQALTLVVNEIAPRPHNSGHYSQDGCDVSQFELQVRCMTGLPLTQPRLHSPSIMLNLLGDVWFQTPPAKKSGSDPHSKVSSVRAEAHDTAHTPDWAQVLALPGVHLHLYGKSQARVGRKMGHVNITGDTPDAVRATAARVADVLGMAPF